LNPLNFLGRTYDVLDAVVLAACGFLAAVLLVGGPLFLTYSFFSEQRYLAAFLSAAIWLGFAVAGVRDLWRRRFSWASGSLLVLWFAIVLTLGRHA
jgi:hypothetical protein